jgi:hypothetical protein
MNTKEKLESLTTEQVRDLLGLIERLGKIEGSVPLLPATAVRLIDRDNMKLVIARELHKSVIAEAATFDQLLTLIGQKNYQNHI